MEGDALKQAIETVVQRAFPSSKILSLSIKAGSNHGDNFMGVMHAIDVELEDSNGFVDRKYLALKTSPENAARREYADNLAVFDKEAGFYRMVVPELMKFQEGRSGSGKLIEPAFVKCYDVWGSREDVNRRPDGSKDSPPAVPWYYILMQDMREGEDGGYRMADKYEGLDYDHCNLVITELARYHALSYAYMTTLNSKTELFDKFPFLKESWLTTTNAPVMKGLYSVGKDACLKALTINYPENSNEYQKLKKLAEGAYQVVTHFLAGSTDLGLNEMVSTPVNMDDVNLVNRERKEKNQWLVLIHGDSNVNNFLFKYSGKKPTAVKIIDLQVVREVCLTTDLSYFFYMSTTAELRKKYFDQLLITYYNTFTEVCDTLKIAPWADFTVENLKKKYRTKGVMFGAASGLVFLPCILVPKTQAVDLDAATKDGDVFGSVGEGLVVKNELMEERVLSTAQELLEYDIFN